MGQEAGAGSENCDGKPAESRLIRVKGKQPQEKGGDNRYGRSKAVNSVKEIHGIGEADHPQHGEGDVQQRFPQGTEKEGELDVPDENDEEGDQDLQDEFEEGGQRKNVVHEAHKKNKAPSQQQDLHPRQKDPVEKNRSREGDIDGNSTQERCGLVMNLAGVGMIENVPLQGD